MANTVKIKRSAVPGKVPAVGDLSLGELAINTYDGKLYTKKDVSGAESVVLLGGGELLASNNLSDVANAGTARTNLGLAIGTNVQAYDAGLQSIAGLTTAADRMIYTTASDTYAVTTLTAFGRSIIDDADATAGRSTLGLGTAATRNTGTSGSVIPTLDQAGNWTSDHIFSNNVTIEAPIQRQSGKNRANLGAPTITDMALYDAQMNNKIAFYPEANVIFEKSTDGTNWTTESVSSTNVKRLLAGADAKTVASIAIPRDAVKYRIRITNNGNYVYLNTAYLYASANGNTFAMEMWKKNFTTGLWGQHTSDTTQQGSWPGHHVINYAAIPFHPSQHFNEVYLLITPVWAHASNTITLYSLEMHGGYPAGRRTIYTVDENKLVEFPAGVTSTAFTENGVLLSSKYAALSHTHTMSQITDMSAFGRTLVDDADASAARTTLGLVIGTNVQAQDAELAAIAGLTSAADGLPYFTGSGTAALATFTAAGRALVDDVDAAAQRTTLGLGTSAIVNTGTSGATIPLLNAANMWSADQTISSTAPGLVFNETDAAVDNTLWRIRANASTFILTTLDKDGLNPNTALSIGRSGVSIGAVAISGSALTFNANTVWHAGNTHTHAAGDVTSGTFADARIPSLDTSKITTGVMATARLGTGTANSTTYLRGDGTWATVAGGSGDMLKSENLSGLANYTTARSNLGLGTAATVNTGTSGATIPLLNAANTFSAAQGLSNNIALNILETGATARSAVKMNTSNVMEFGNANNNATFLNSATTFSGVDFTINTTNRPMIRRAQQQALLFGNAAGATRYVIGRDSGGTDAQNFFLYDDAVANFIFTVDSSRVVNITNSMTIGANTVQTDGVMRMRRNGNNIEWGHTNTAGYQATLGSFTGAGDPFIAFNAEHGTNSNTFRTRGRFGGVIYIAGGDGRMHFGHLANHTADNQTLAIGLTLDINGNLGLGTTSPTNFGAGWRALTIGESGKNGVVRLTSGTVTADMFTDTSALFIRTATNHSIVFRTNDADRATITSAGLQLSDLGPTSEFAAGFRGTPVNRQDSSYTLVLTDAGKTILKGTNTASQTYTIPANGSVAYPVGTILTFANLGNVAMSIAITTDPMYLSPGGSTGTRTLAGFGMATAVKVTSTNWMISGVGLT